MNSLTGVRHGPVSEPPMIPPEGTTILAASGLKAPGSADAKDAMSGLLRQGGWTPLRLDDALFVTTEPGLRSNLLQSRSHGSQLTAPLLQGGALTGAARGTVRTARGHSHAAVDHERGGSGPEQTN